MQLITFLLVTQSCLVTFTRTPTATIITGADISHHDHSIKDWTALSKATSGILCVIFNIVYTFFIIIYPMWASQLYE